MFSFLTPDFQNNLNMKKIFECFDPEIHQITFNVPAEEEGSQNENNANKRKNASDFSQRRPKICERDYQLLFGPRRKWIYHTLQWK
jgi:hypothetical protein